VCESVYALSRNLLGKQDEEGSNLNLVRAGEVHEIVEKARSGLSSNNMEAVRKRLKADRLILDDTVGELAELVENEGDNADADENEDEEFDDGEWDELGLGSSKKMSPAELDRTKRIQPILRFSALMHKRILLDVLTSQTAVHADNAALDILPSHSHSLLLASEEVVSTLHAPQDLSDIASSVEKHADVVARLQALLVDRDLLPVPSTDVDAIAEGLEALKVGDSQKKARKDVRRWFDTCFAQIQTLSSSVAASLAQEGEVADVT